MQTKEKYGIGQKVKHRWNPWYGEIACIITSPNCPVQYQVNLTMGVNVVLRENEIKAWDGKY
jgi:hypothetical protein